MAATQSHESNGVKTVTPVNRMTEAIQAQPKKEKPPKPLSLVQYEINQSIIRIEGTSPLVVHAWDVKTIRMMEEKQAGAATKGRQKRNPEAEYQAAFYVKKSGVYGVPLLGIKAAVVTAATSLGREIPKTLIRQAFHIIDADRDQLCALHYPADVPPVMDTSMVRVGMGTADVRYRPKFQQWGVEVQIEFNERALTLEKLVNLFNLAGFAVGLCEHRPERDGSWGRFQVVNQFSWVNDKPDKKKKK